MKFVGVEFPAFVLFTVNGRFGYTPAVLVFPKIVMRKVHVVKAGITPADDSSFGGLAVNVNPVQDDGETVFPPIATLPEPIDKGSLITRSVIISAFGLTIVMFQTDT